MCCFDDWDGESCREFNEDYCESYSSCSILVDVPEEIVSHGGNDNESGGGNGNEAPTSNTTVGSSPVDHGDDEKSGMKIAVKAVCGLGDQNPGDDSWVAACTALCANHLCCFSTDGTKGSCHETYGDDVCNAYKGCGVLNLSDGNK